MGGLDLLSAGGAPVKDIWGNVVTVEEARELKRRRKPTPKKGYAAPPGTGPDGETCGSCRHLFRNRMAKTYLKCGLMWRFWTGGAGSDVLAKSPACRNWEAEEDTE